MMMQRILIYNLANKYTPKGRGTKLIFDSNGSIVEALLGLIIIIMHDKEMFKFGFMFILEALSLNPMT